MWSKLWAVAKQFLGWWLTKPAAQVRPEDLRGKSIGIARAGNISERLSKAVVKRFNIPENEVTIRPVGGSQSERFQAMRMNIVQAIVITPPLDVRAKNEGFNVLFRLIDLGVPFVDYDGKTKAGRNSYGWKPDQTRPCHIVHKHLHYSIETAMKNAVNVVQSQLVPALTETAKVEAPGDRQDPHCQYSDEMTGGGDA